MKSCLTLILALFTITSLFAQTECTVKIVNSKNSTTPASYTFKTDPVNTAAGTRYYWSFGDNTTSDSPAPKHTYSKEGSYLVQVKVTGGDGKVCYGELKAQFAGGAAAAQAVTLAGKGKVKKITSNDGCGLLITMDNGKVLVPMAESVQFSYTDGQYVELSYQLLDKSSGCPVGVAAKIIQIAAINTTVPCTVRIVTVKNSTNPVTYTFKTDPRAEGAQYYWKFGDNTTGDGATPTHAFAKTGTYPIVVKVTAADGKICMGELKAEFAGAPVPAVTTLSGKGKVKRTGTDACGVTITMENGKVLVPMPESVQFSYTDGQYVELSYQLLDKTSGCNTGVAARISKITAITPVVPCTVKIVSVKNNTTPASYTFKTDPVNTAVGTKYYWYFGDNAISDSPAPKHTYNKEGSYLVQVKVLGSDGKVCYGELKAQFAGGTVPTPVVTLTAKGKVRKAVSTDGCGLLITLDNGTVIVPVEMAVPFEFKNDQYVELAYNLLKDKPSGCASGVSAKISKIVAINTVVPCIVKIVAVKNSTNPVTYTFKTDPRTEGAKYLWKFGDNTTGDGATPTHAFAKTGTYPIVVQVTASDGKICMGELKAEFAGAPASTVATLSGKGKVRKTGTDACGVTITMDNLKVLVPMAESMQFSYTDGQYVELTYQLLDKTSGCNTGVAAKIIQIAAITPVAPCTVKIVSVKNSTTPASYTFKTDPANTATGTRYYWYFGDNTISDSPAPKHTYSKEGSYLVQVKVLGSDGKVCYGELKAQFAGGTVTPPVVTLPTCKGQVNLLLIDPTEKDCNGSATVKLLDENGKEIPNVKYKWLDGRTGSSVGSLCPEKVYIVQSVVENVCQKTTSFTLLSQYRWTTTTLNGQNNFTVSAPVQGVQYEWNFGDGKVLTGASVNYNFQKDGVYDVTLKAVSVNGTLVSSQPVVVMQNIAKKAIMSESEMEIYPNPVKETLSVNFKNSGEEKLTFEIKNMAGQVVYKNQINNDGSSHTDINVQNLNTGMYVLRIYNGQKVTGDRKFIKTN